MTLKFDKCKRKKGIDKPLCEIKIIVKDKKVRKLTKKLILTGIVIAQPQLAPLQNI